MWAVLDLEADPFGVSALARKFGVDTGTIYNILKRKTHL